MDRMYVRWSLSCWRRKSRAENPKRPLSADTIPSEVLALGGRGTWYRVVGNISVSSKVAGTLAWSSTWGGDVGGTVSGSADNAEMSAAESGTDVRGEFPSLDVIIRGWGAWSRKEASGAEVTGW